VVAVAAGPVDVQLDRFRLAVTDVVADAIRAAVRDHEA
jgi:hypothetical protein